MRRREIILAALVLGIALSQVSRVLPDEPVLRWTKTFDYPVGDFAIGVRPDGNNYLKVVVIEEWRFYGKVLRSVEFYNEEMELTKTVDLPEFSAAAISEDGKYVGTFVPLEIGGEWITKSRFTMYNDRGDSLWVNESIPYPDLFYIIDAGSTLISEGMYGIGFYDPRGRVALAEHRLYYPTSTSFHVAVTESTVVANAAYEQGGAYVAKFDKHGSRLWQTTLPKDIAYRVGISPDGSSIAAEAADNQLTHVHIFLLDRDGHVNQSFEVRALGSYTIDIPEDADVVAAVGTGNRIYYYDVPDSSLKWVYTDPDTNRAFVSVDVSEVGIRKVIVGATTRDRIQHNPALPRWVYIFNQDGGLLWQEDYSGERYMSDLAGPLVRFADPEGRKFFVASVNTVYYYRGWGHGSKF